MKSGFMAIIGRPNVGKSTLLNNILKNKIAIVSDKPGTTRHRIHGVYNDEDTQIVFVDTPGIHKPKHKLGERLNKFAYQSISDVDAILFIVDASTTLGTGDLRIIEMLKKQKIPVILILNKIDKISKEKIINKIEEYQKEFSFQEIIPISAKKETDGDYLIQILKKYANDEIIYYPKDQITDKSTEFMIAEIVREKVLLLTKEEVPHSVTCVVESIKKSKNNLIITVLIIVDRDALKRIIIGKSGQMIKEIGILARPEIEKLLEKPIYLELFVKVMKKWRDKENSLHELGYDDR